MHATVKVWDPLVRLFHWSLAGLFLANFFTEDGELVHRGIGYAVLALLAVRFVWGWIGTRHARFSDWAPGPRRVREYLHERLAGRSRRQLGHNPGAAVMILALLAGVLLVGVSGWLMTWPATPVDGWMLSERFVWSFPMNKDPGEKSVGVAASADRAATTFPDSLADRATALRPDDAWVAASPLAYQVKEYGAPFHPLLRDETHVRVFEAMWPTTDEKFGAVYTDDQKQSHPMIMGCYGIGISRTLQAVVEQSNDADGIIWPWNVAPWQVLVINLDPQDAAAKALCEKLAQAAEAAGADVLVDDRAERPGVKFKDADLIGLPLRLTVGGKGLKEGIFELKWRTAKEVRKVAIAEAESAVTQAVREAAAKA